MSARTEIPVSQQIEQLTAIVAALNGVWITVTPTHPDATRWTLRDDAAGRGFDPRVHSWQAVRADGLRIGFDWPSVWGRKPLRLEISPVWPRDAKGESARPYNAAELVSTITVDPAKPAKQIAADIARRLLPAWEPEWTKAQERIASRNSYADQTAATKAALVAAGARSSRNSDTTVYLGAESYAYDVTAQGGDVRFEHFNVPLAVALAILPLLRKPTPEPTAEPTDEEIAAAFDAHRAEDPHCTCDDCIVWHAAHLEG